MTDDTAKKILVVDDDKSLVEMIRLKLMSEGYKVFTSYNGSDALEQAKAKKPDLILLDIMMPKMDGAQMEKELRAFKETEGIPVIFITCTIDKKQAAAMDHKLGKHLVVAKPFDGKELLAAIDNVLNDKQQSPEA